MWSGADLEGRQVWFCNTHALGQNDAEAVEECGLSGVWLGDAPQTDLSVSCGGQDDIVRGNARELFEDGARGVSEARAALPHLQALPQYEGEETDEDVRLNAILALVPDRPHVELVFLDGEGGFGLRELDVGFPELLIAPAGDV